MKTNRWIAMLLCVCFAAISLNAAELWETLPKPTRAVNDYARIIDSGTESRLERFLTATEMSVDTPIVVVTLPSLEGGQIDDFTNRLYEKWGIGTPSVNKGVLFLIAVQERKMRIETGYGTEPVITDTLASALIQQVARPQFKAGDYSAGIDQVCRMIAGTIAETEGKEISGAMSYQTISHHQNSGGGLFRFIFFAIVILSILGGGGRRRHGLSGLIIPLLLTSGGFRGGSRGGFGSSGGFGGGFGGFGGGMSGGGGASGGW